MKHSRILASSSAALLALGLAAAPLSSVSAADQTYEPSIGADVWDLTTSNWDSGSAPWVNGNNAIFGGTSETVDLNADITVGSITFNSTGYTIADSDNNGSLTLGGAPSTITVTTAGHTATISETIANTGGLTKAGAGTLIFSGTNGYAGATVISAGTLEFQGAAAMSSSSALSMSNNTTLSLRADADTAFTPVSFTNLTAGSTYNISVSSINGSAIGKTLSLGAPAGGGGGTGTTSLNVSGTAGAGYTLKFTTPFATNSNSGGAWSAAGPNVFNLTNADVILDAGVNMGNNGNGAITVNSTTGNSLTINGTVTTNTNRTTAGIVNSGVLTLNNGVALNGANQGFFVILNGGKLNVNNAGSIRNNANIGGTGNRAGLTIAGGTLDNTSGSAKALSFNPTVGFNGDFAFSSAGGTSANDLNLGTGATYLGTAASGTGATRTITTNGSATLTVGGAITSNGATPNNITKEGTGTLVLSGNSSATYLGTTSVNNGKLLVSGSVTGSAALSATNSGSLLLGGSGATPLTGAGRLKDDASVMLGNAAATGTPRFGIDPATTFQLDETVGALTLSSASIIDFSTVSAGGILRFADSSGQSWSGTLSIYNWSGNGTGTGIDQLFFGSGTGALTQTQLNQIVFYSGEGTGQLGSAAFLAGGAGQLVPVPEPSTLAAGLLALGILGFHRPFRRRE